MVVYSRCRGEAVLLYGDESTQLPQTQVSKANMRGSELNRVRAKGQGTEDSQ